MPYNNLDVLKDAQGIVIIVDETRNHNLRSQPLLLSLGYQNFTYPLSWRTINWTSYEVLNETFIRSTTFTDIPDPFVIFTTQYWENRFSYNSINRMINKVLESKTKLIIVCDTKRYQTFGTHRPLFEQDFVKKPPLTYSVLFLEYSKDDTNFTYPLKDSKNIFYQKCASLITEVCNTECYSLNRLHELLVEDQYNPLWNYYSSIFMTPNGISIPVDEKTSRLISFLSNRVEMNDGDIKNFIHRLRGRAEKLLNPRLRTKKMLSNSNLSAETIKKYISVREEFGLK